MSDTTKQRAFRLGSTSSQILRTAAYSARSPKKTCTGRVHPVRRSIRSETSNTGNNWTPPVVTMPVSCPTGIKGASLLAAILILRCAFNNAVSSSVDMFSLSGLSFCMSGSHSLSWDDMGSVGVSTGGHCGRASSSDWESSFQKGTIFKAKIADAELCSLQWDELRVFQSICPKEK